MYDRAVRPDHVGAAVRAVVQRVSTASVTVDGETVSAIGPGLLVLLGVHRGDGEVNADRLARRIRSLRIFPDAEGRMSRSADDEGLEILCVSQFTLYADTRRGNRPGFAEAAPASQAEPLYERVREALRAEGGRFGAHMAVTLVNDGPVTLILDA